MDGEGFRRIHRNAPESFMLGGGGQGGQEGGGLSEPSQPTRLSQPILSNSNHKPAEARAIHDPRSTTRGALLTVSLTSELSQLE
jgi:hypothetical protein